MTNPAPSAPGGAETTASQSGTPDENKPDESKRPRRLFIVATMLVIGVIALVWGRMLLPTEKVITSLSSYRVVIQEAGSPDVIPTESLVFQQQPDGATRIQLTITEGATSSGNGTSTPANPGRQLNTETMLDLFGSGITLQQCPQPPHCYATNSSAGRETVIVFSLSASRPAQTAIVTDPSLGFAYDSQSALAETPYVSLQSQLLIPVKGQPPVYSNPNDQPFSIQFRYDIPHANGYDWSMPPLSVDSGQVAWGDTIVPVDGGAGKPTDLAGSAQATEMTGADHVAQAVENQDIFISGILFGVAGGAALTAVLEFLHLILKVD